MLYKVLFAVVLLFLGTEADEMIIKSNAYDDFLSRYGRQNALEISDINDITRNLLQKFNCYSFGLTVDCFNVRIFV